MKLHLDGKPQENTHIMGYVELIDLSPSLRDALRLRESENIDALNCIIYFEIHVVDRSEQHAEVVLDSARILSPVPELFADVPAGDLCAPDLEPKIHDKIDWNAFWSDLDSEVDRWYDTLKDRLGDLP